MCSSQLDSRVGVGSRPVSVDGDVGEIVTTPGWLVRRIDHNGIPSMLNRSPKREALLDALSNVHAICASLETRNLGLQRFDVCVLCRSELEMRSVVKQ